MRNVRVGPDGGIVLTVYGIATEEQADVLQEFIKLLVLPSKDGGKKRARGKKPPWWKDDSHEAAIFSHLNKRMHGELKDKESGAHPYVHMAWRALAIAYQETYGQVPPS